MKPLSLLIIVAAGIVAIVAACSSTKSSTSQEAPLEPANGLQTSAAFADIEPEDERSKAVFNEMAKVLTHPRCMNCHPTGDTPMQGDEMLPHQPLVVRGEDGFGAPGMRCGSCHGDANFETVPGDPHWHLAPREMAWQGKSVSQICEQLKDQERNGGLDLEGLAKHNAEDGLVGWGWNPPEHLEPAPGSQAIFGELTRAWVASGAHCP